MSNSSDLSIKNKDDFPINSILKARLDLQQIGILVQELWNSVGSSILLYGELFQCSKVRLNYLDLLCFIHDILI